jgi:hypothetical protein
VVLEFLDHLTLPKVALTCKALNALSVSLLGQELRITLPLDVKLILPTPAALAVRRIIISTHPKLTATLTNLLSCLPRFANLRSLTLRRAHILSSHWHQLHQMTSSPPPPNQPLRHLTTLTLFSCTRESPSAEHPPLPLSHVHILGMLLFDFGWGELASPAHLTHLTIPSMSTHDAERMPPLPHLRALRICENYQDILQCAHFLSTRKSPRLVSFELDSLPPRIQCSIAVTPGITFDLPELREYRGPHSYAPIFARAAPLVNASLWCAQVSAGATDAAPTTLLQLAELAPALKTLRLCGFQATTSTLDAVGAFGALEELVINLRGTALNSVIRTVRTSFPCHARTRLIFDPWRLEPHRRPARINTASHSQRPYHLRPPPRGHTYTTQP